MANPIKVLGRIASIHTYGEGVYEVTFEVPLRVTRFLPGQFLHLTLDPFDPTTGYWPESRVFSIASQPRQDSVTVVYSVKGQYTRRMERELRVGHEVWLKLPYGDFIINEDLLDQGPVVLLAGGTGVAPYWPFLRARSARGGEVHLYYGIRRPDHLLFRDGLMELQHEPWFRLHLTVEDGVLDGLPSARGRLSIVTVAHDLGPAVDTANFFLSGPPVMIHNFKSQLGALSVESKRIHIDEWE